MTNSPRKPKASPPRKKTAKRATPAKRFLMPPVDLGGLGGDDEADDLPPLDLGRFDRADTKALSSEEDVQLPTHRAPTSAIEQPTQGVTRAPAHDAGTSPSVPASSAPEPTRGNPAATDDRPELPVQTSASPTAEFEARIQTERAVGAAETPLDDSEQLLSEPAEQLKRTSAAAAPPVTDSAVPAVLSREATTQPARHWGPSAGVTGMPARRPRRAPSRPFTPQQSDQRRDDRLRELMDRAPRYAALLQSYAVAQSGKEPLQNRNIQLYGLTAQELADRITVDKAVMTAVNLPTPRFTPAHYIDAVLDQALGELDPQGTSIDKMEAERDIVWELARDALAYRDHITADPEIAAMKKPRSQCPLRVKVNQRYSRMMDILRTMPDLKAQPFEIASACVAKYLEGLHSEQTAFEEFWSRNIVSTYE